MAIRRALGTLEPVIYFRNARGHVMLAPYSSMPTPAGYEREEAGSLPEIDKLIALLSAQETRQLRAEHEREEAIGELVRNKVRDNLMQRLCSSETSAMERDFIHGYLALQEDKRIARHAKYSEYVFYLHARDFDLGNRGAGEEVWKG
jgi:hypothetical protein